jgi:hypothetical protein
MVVETLKLQLDWADASPELTVPLPQGWEEGRGVTFGLMRLYFHSQDAWDSFWERVEDWFRLVMDPLDWTSLGFRYHYAKAAWDTLTGILEQKLDGFNSGLRQRL